MSFSFFAALEPPSLKDFHLVFTTWNRIKHTSQIRISQSKITSKQCTWRNLLNLYSNLVASHANTNKHTHSHSHYLTTVRKGLVCNWILLLWGWLSSGWADQSLWCEKWFWSAAVVIDSSRPPLTRDAALQKNWVKALILTQTKAEFYRLGACTHKHNHIHIRGVNSMAWGPVRLLSL